MTAAKRTKRAISPATSWGVVAGIVALALVFGYIAFGPYFFGNAEWYDRAAAAGAVGATSTPATATSTPAQPACPPVDPAAYDKKMQQLANYPVVKVASTTAATSTLAATSTKPVKLKPWPVLSAPRPLPCALLPFNRIVAYYGNFYSKGMGVLGQYPTDVMLGKLRAVVAQWQAADPSTPVIPAIHYIVETAQGTAQADGTYRLRMPDSQIDIALADAAKVNGIVFIDFQVGKSTVQKELPIYESYLKMPNVELGIDPEFSMKDGAKPGTEIGTLDAADINYAMQYLAKLVRDNNLPPKILVIHRFTEAMVTNYKKITPLPEVQFVMDMDGWGSQAKKAGTYTNIVAAEPVQFTGFKLFYKNDLLPPSTGMFTPAQLLKFSPQPSYIQYQ